MSARRLRSVEDIMGEVREILSADNTDLRSFIYREILLNALKCKQDELDILDLKIISRVVAEIRHAARVFKPYRMFRKVSVFGSARIPEGNPYYELAVHFGSLLAEQDFMVITGAASGIMRAAIEGAGPEDSFGVNILLPFERWPVKVALDDARSMRFHYFFTRKLFFVMEADAFALFPGGFGTQDEAFEVLTLLQTGKAPPMPLVLMELPHDRYWEMWDQFVGQQMLVREYISPEDLSFYRIVRSPEEGVDWIKFYYSTYHSIRQVQNMLVIRLEKELRDDHIRLLNESFRDLIKSGEIARASALPQEEDEPDLLSKPRIAFCYNKRSAGRLNEMILAINRMGASIQPAV